eukprot:CAMPEP_0177687584 /NCGR_PEP_ID=MMETSP0447-20121125/34205_1 /TAXON_ID=0 /ORGANISM="Stygamoeba regulata, Strain BSH-02190019" /LENGTH=151 /DNA_ID=CAMNT_0019197833 /DNA_START=788 /DNA_END=1239 /DNA_ORIENTATION=+
MTCEIALRASSAGTASSFTGWFTEHNASRMRCRHSEYTSDCEGALVFRQRLWFAPDGAITFGDSICRCRPARKPDRFPGVTAVAAVFGEVERGEGDRVVDPGPVGERYCIVLVWGGAVSPVDPACSRAAWHADAQRSNLSASRRRIATAVA